MPRSFSFDHFKAQKPRVSRSLQKKAKQKVAGAEQHATSGGGDLHYGKRYAKTEQLAREKSEHASETKEAQPSVQKNPRPPQDDERIPARLEQAIEGGYVPAVPEPQLGQTPPAVPPAVAASRGVFDVLQEGREQALLLANSSLAVGRAGLRLAQLSLELIWVAATGSRRRVA